METSHASGEQDFPRKRNRILAALAIAAALVIINFISLLAYDLLVSGGASGADQPQGYSYDSCNVQGIVMHGDMYTYPPYAESGDSEGEGDAYVPITTSENVLYWISDAQYRDNVKAILLEVDSYGGSPAAAEEISKAVRDSGKPVVAFVRSAAASAAYYSIAYADRIFALNNSDVGSIGVTQSYVDNVEANRRDGHSYVELSTGKFKDSGAPDKPLTQEERDLFMRDLNIIFENFIQAVAAGRGLDPEQVRQYADGSTVLGRQAMEMGLVDEIGGYEEALSYVEDRIGETAEVCW